VENFPLKNAFQLGIDVCLTVKTDLKHLVREKLKENNINIRIE
jgi:hypothetical protein